MSDEASAIRAAIGDCRWAGVEPTPYKEEGAAPFKAVTRQTLFADPHLAAELRYFEIDAGGFSTLERHAHVHSVMILRGRGRCLVGAKVHDVKIHDLVTIPRWSWHQFRAAADERLGFLCLVNAERDRPQLPGEEDIAALRAIPEVAEFLG